MNESQCRIGELAVVLGDNVNTGLIVRSNAPMTTATGRTIGAGRRGGFPVQRSWSGRSSKTAKITVPPKDRCRIRSCFRSGA